MRYHGPVPSLLLSFILQKKRKKKRERVWGWKREIGERTCLEESIGHDTTLQQAFSLFFLSFLFNEKKREEEIDTWALCSFLPFLSLENRKKRRREGTGPWYLICNHLFLLFLLKREEKETNVDYKWGPGK